MERDWNLYFWKKNQHFNRLKALYQKHRDGCQEESLFPQKKHKIKNRKHKHKTYN